MDDMMTREEVAEFAAHGNHPLLWAFIQKYRNQLDVKWCDVMQQCAVESAKIIADQQATIVRLLNERPEPMKLRDI